MNTLTSLYVAAGKDGIFDTIRGLTSDAQTAFNGIVLLVAAICVTIYTLKGGFSLGKLITSGLAAALLCWLVIGTNGLGYFKDKINNELKPAASVVRVVDVPVVDRV